MILDATFCSQKRVAGKSPDKGGFQVVMASEECMESKESASLEELGNQPHYLLNDDDIHCSGASRLAEGTAVRPKTVIMHDETLVKITNTVARQSVQLLKQYLVEQSFSGSHHAAPHMCTYEVFGKHLLI